ncbi:peptide-methionine (S)-S-oxide reductase [Flavobacterium sp. Fl-318]|uniref:peptide-methionine (S)-S-oxide reductase n=1 Tax=Flavobacterium cupriresistens TaxID=2893885 RepID=A0ABU4R677_9FLAO|nr:MULTISPECIES: peptide-methionine (S)-S-oxide reductase [unclassified Flavobacterium]MDX6188084.1 peptide-methionine (S)-S-oxide reductase [Flavobacterium sp. Fl-318]UFH41996.1 peptide-methionine (S)-S-oxide reductase [Flavobacterium sp. F-323]
MRLKIGFGGGCHWCTEAVFQTLIGVELVEQGWIESVEPQDYWSEAVIVHFDTDLISLKTLIEIHLLTHASTSNHSMRSKYRSAIYYFDEQQKEESLNFISELQTENTEKYITQILPFVQFKINKDEFLNYYKTRKEAPFCETYIRPKLNLLFQKYSKYTLKD